MSEKESPSATAGQGEGARLKEGPAPELMEASFARELADAPILHRGLGLADLAHVVALTETGVIPEDASRRLLALLLELGDVAVEDFPMSRALEDVYSNREAWVRSRDADAAGWMGAGRPRREPATIAFRIAARERLLALAAAQVRMGRALVEQASAHVATIVPDYTYLQPATPTSLAHYLLSFAYPVLRDLERVQAAYARTNVFPGGIGNINGTRLPVDRPRLSSLLGFDALISNTRDAMWQTDQPVEVLAMLVAHLVHLDRLAEDLQIWNTQEFGLVELADRHARISMIMPQKKNPYSLAFVRGITGDMLGRLVSMAAVGKTPSAQMDNRIFALGTVPRAIEETTRTTSLLAGVVAALRFDTELMRARAGEGFTHAMDLAETIMTECRLTYRSAHRIVGLAVRRALELDPDARDIPRGVLDAAAREVVGRELPELSAEALAQVADPTSVVASRTGVGGAAAEPVANMLAECSHALARAERWQIETESRVVEAEGRLVELARARAGGPAGGQPHV